MGVVFWDDMCLVHDHHRACMGPSAQGEQVWVKTQNPGTGWVRAQGCFIATRLCYPVELKPRH